MPAYVDLVGRACELSVTNVLCPTEETKRKQESILSRIQAKYPNNYRVHFKRIEVATEHAVKQIQSELGAKKLRRAEWTGESHKGIDNTDIVIQTEVGVSVKIYLGQDEVTSFAVYAQSASQGRTGGLRIATWTPYQP